MAPNKVHNALIRVLVLWFFVSASYYAGNFISGDVLADRRPNLGHQAFKYIVIVAISFVIVFLAKSRIFLLLYLYLFLVLGFLLFIQYFGVNVVYAINFHIMFTSFVGLIFIFSKLDSADLKKIIICIVFSGILVSFISYYEYLFMEPVLGDYWRNTGGYRSISTLLNPNNLGMYLGATILLLLKSKAMSGYKPIILIILLSSLLMSGSRTAVVALVFVVIVTSIFSSSGSINLKNLIGWLVAMGGGVMFLLFNQWDAPERMVNMETATIRVNKYADYILSVDASYLLPDFNGVRIDAVSENAYFYLLNAFGLLFFLFSVFVLSVFFQVRDFGERSLEGLAFKSVFLYYLIASTGREDQSRGQGQRLRLHHRFVRRTG